MERTSRSKVPSAKQVWFSKPVEVSMPFNCNDGDYATFIDSLREKLADHARKCCVQGRPILAQKRNYKPARWMHIELLGVMGQRTVLAVRDDTVYLIGFQAQNKKWYEFGFEGKRSRLIPGSIFLECDVNYRSILGHQHDGAKRLVPDEKKDGVGLGRTPLIDAVGRLSAYEQLVGQGVDEDTKLALARLIVMYCESARMFPHCEVVQKRWESTSFMTERHVDYMWNWGNMSRMLLGWTIPPQDEVELNRIGIVSIKDAVKVVGLVLNSQPRRPGGDTGQGQTQHLQPPQPPGGADKQGAHKSPPGHSQPQQPRTGSGESSQRHQPRTVSHGQPLVEVFSVYANFSVVGTMSVFDGIRGQIIYKNSQQGQDYSHSQEDFTPLVLTGPYRAISAEGESFTVKITPSGSDESGDTEDDATLWECNVQDANEVVQASLKTGDGDILVTYAVLSDAIEVAMEVNLVHLKETSATSTHIYGKIFAQIPQFNKNDIFLFNRGPKEQVELVASSNGLIVPLARSVVAVPTGPAPLLMKIRLEAKTVNREGIATISLVDEDLEISLVVEDLEISLVVECGTASLQGIDERTSGTRSVSVDAAGECSEGGGASDESCSNGSTSGIPQGNAKHERTNQGDIQVKINHCRGSILPFNPDVLLSTNVVASRPIV